MSINAERSVFDSGANNRSWAAINEGRSRLRNRRLRPCVARFIGLRFSDRMRAIFGATSRHSAL
jgi:hypothetical protein